MNYTFVFYHLNKLLSKYIFLHNYFHDKNMMYETVIKLQTYCASIFYNI